MAQKSGRVNFLTNLMSAGAHPCLCHFWTSPPIQQKSCPGRHPFRSFARISTCRPGLSSDLAFNGKRHLSTPLGQGPYSSTRPTPCPTHPAPPSYSLLDISLSTIRSKPGYVEPCHPLCCSWSHPSLPPPHQQGGRTQFTRAPDLQAHLAPAHHGHDHVHLHRSLYQQSLPL